MIQFDYSNIFQDGLVQPSTYGIPGEMGYN